MQTCSRALRTSDWGEGSPSNRTTTLSTQTRQRRSGFGTSLWMSLSGPAWAQTWTQSNISGDLKIAVQQRSPANLTELENGDCRKWVKLTKYRCVKLVASYPRSLNAVIAAKGASTKYRVKGLNTYVNVISVFFAKCSKNLFLLRNYGVLCVDWWGEKSI